MDIINAYAFLSKRKLYIIYSYLLYTMKSYLSLVLGRPGWSKQCASCDLDLYCLPLTQQFWHTKKMVTDEALLVERS